MGADLAVAANEEVQLQAQAGDKAEVVVDAARGSGGVRASAAVVKPEFDSFPGTKAGWFDERRVDRTHADSRFEQAECSEIQRL